METEKPKVEQLKEDKNVRRELEQATGSKPKRKPTVEVKQKFWLGTYVVILLSVGVLYYLVRFGLFDFLGDYARLLERFTIGALAIVLLLVVLKAVKIYLIGRLADNIARYNLSRVANLLAGLAIFFIILSILFANWYTAVLSLGLISLVLGFALQTPIASFIGWIYILVKVPYQVGDRIKIDTSTGDVISVNYLDTILWEFGGELLSTSNHPTGRIIKFPNSKVLDSVVYNYSWSLFPYVWNDIKFQIAYQSDLEFVARVMRETAEEEVGEIMMERVSTYRELLAQTPVDQLEVQERPVVVFRVAENTWVEAIVRYLVEPKRAGAVKSRLIKTMLERLNAEPGKVMFPKADMR
ncbi:MAG TPA: mechanosensitive ion channel family protein [Pyrinomonadaceae bacterium]|nr:mechanosensitive ion channel family protein [Pyrinomonadaceae bacterium]